MLTIGEARIDVAAETGALHQVAAEAGAGGVVTFSGVMRSEGGQATCLFLDHYPGFTEKVIQDFADGAAHRFDLAAWRIIHRVGEIAPGETIVFVGTAARHRREAFSACDYLMDYLKSAAPFWKRETGPGGERWIEPTARDHIDRQRWDQSD